MADELVPKPGAHDAAGGFHDIKPLPEFSPFPWDIVWAGVGLLALLLLIFVLLRRRSRGAAVSPAAPPLTAFEAALASIRELELLRSNQRISLRDFSSRLSLVLRLFLEQTLHFPAAEQTTAEVARSLPEKFRSCLPTFPKERVAEITAQVRTVLRFLEGAAFANDSTEKYHLESEEVRSIPPRIETLIRDLHAQLRREEERTRSVMDGEARPC